MIQAAANGVHGCGVVTIGVLVAIGDLPQQSRIPINASTKFIAAALRSASPPRYPKGVIWVRVGHPYDDVVSNQRVLSAVSGRTRLLGLLLLMFGVAAMHVGVFTIGADTGRMMLEHSVVAPSPAHHPAAFIGHDMSCHGAMHACEFILSATALIIGLVLLAWWDTALEAVGRFKARLGRTYHERPPPWTVPSLAELSILRV
jgi:hypothetical protein